MAPKASLTVQVRNPDRSQVLFNYGIALLAQVLAIALSRLFVPFMGSFIAFAFSFLAVAFSAWYCGLGSGVATAILGLVGLKFWFIPPVGSLAMTTLKSVLAVVALLIIYAAIIAMGEARRRENMSLHHAQGELEERVHERTAELDSANRGLRELTARLMQLQDDERRRIARELHDSVGQTLAALTMNLTAVSVDLERLNQTAKTVNDSLALAQEMSKEVRTVSYLLHPPLLDEAGLVSALRWYVDGFSERSKIQVSLEIPDNFGRLPQEAETALFRTVQECLTNIHRHSGSTVAAIRLTRAADEIRLKVEDKGTGIATKKLEEITSGGIPGVGIRGMRERIRQLGGSLTVDSTDIGTKVEARLPVKPASLAASEAAA